MRRARSSAVDEFSINLFYEDFPPRFCRLAPTNITEYETAESDGRAASFVASTGQEKEWNERQRKRLAATLNFVHPHQRREAGISCKREEHLSSGFAGGKREKIRRMVSVRISGVSEANFLVAGGAASRLMKSRSRC